MGAPLGNKFALGNTGGQPPKYNNKEELIDAIQLYFDECIESEIKGTITGLTLRLGFCSRSSLRDYEKMNEEYSHIIRRAKLAVQNCYEQSGTHFDIFALKNMGWKDKSEVAVSGIGKTEQELINETIGKME